MRKGVFILFILIMTLFLVSSYERTNPSFTQYGGRGFTGYGSASQQSCGDAGQDFILQIEPLSCTPAVVRTDLLEDQDVPVFCHISATKVNPYVDVKAIDDIEFTNGDIPDDVRDIGYLPSKAALGENSEYLNNPLFNEIGSAVIILKQQKNASQMPDWIEGEVIATLKYDIENAFGIGKRDFYLPEISDDSEWEDVKATYSFWNGMAYLRADSIDANSVSLGVYDDIRQVRGVTLNKGDTSENIYLPNMECMAGLQVKLNSLEVPDLRARLNVNGDIIEVKDDEKFLDNRCTLTSIQKKGVLEEVEIKCGKDRFPLRIVPKIKLSIETQGTSVDGNYEVGDRLYYTTGGSVYLGYAGLNDVLGDPNSLYVYLFTSEIDLGQTLSAQYLNEIEAHVKKLECEVKKAKGNQLVAGTKCFFSSVAGLIGEAKDYFLDDQSYKKIEYGATEETEDGSTVTLNGFADGNNKVLSEEAELNYEKSIEDYGSVINNYGGIKHNQNSPYTLGEEAMLKKLVLANNLGQKKDVVDICSEIAEKYPNSVIIPASKEYCDKAKISSNGINSHYTTILGEVKEITLERIYEPSLEEYSVKLYVEGSNGVKDETTIGFKERVPLDGFKAADNYPGNYLELDKIRDSGEVDLVFYLNEDKSFFEKAGTLAAGSNRKTIKEGESLSIGNNYRITVEKINLKKVAKVSLKPHIDYEQSRTNFSFKIGIEKRAIKLSPAKIQEKMDSVNKKIESFSEISDNLGSVVKGLKTACIGTQLTLTAKNLLTNAGIIGGAGGKALARQQVMRNSGGWYEKCTEMMNSGRYNSLDACLGDNAGRIDASVEELYTKMVAQNERISSIQNGFVERDWVIDKSINQDAFEKAYLDSIRADLKANLKTKYGGNMMPIGSDNLNIDEFVDKLNADQFSFETLREIELDSQTYGDETLNSISRKSLDVSIKNVYQNAQNINRISSVASAAGVDSNKINFLIAEGAREYPYYGLTYSSIQGKVSIPGVDSNSPVAVVATSMNEEYILILNQQANQYTISDVYDIEGNSMTLPEGLKNVYFKKYDLKAYENPYKSSLGEQWPVIRYFETEPYKGMPSIVPFDLKKGWYASLQPTLPIGRNIRTYDESGLPNSFYVCNVGENGIEEQRKNDDLCTLVTWNTNQDYSQFSGLEPAQAKRVIDNAMSAIETATKAYSPGVDRVAIITDGETYNIRVGKPAVDVPDLKCQDFYSPTDCKILFNVCDPVVCPSSRCNLGGAYPVENVVQTGVAGSVALCFPNFVGLGGDVYIPVCLTGIKAGVDAWNSGLENYRDCLQHSLETGEQIGICDELFSIYGCEFFWKQSIPIAKLALPKFLEFLSGQGVKGGGEYLVGESAVESAEQSFDYFTNYYGKNMFDAFKLRSTEQAGDAFCKVFVSGVYPTSVDALDELTEPDSPTQFYARFEENLYTTETNPPQSHYKVFYHIYAGEDTGVNYVVYFKGQEGGSYYQDTGSDYIVDRGFIAPGDSVSETPDFLAPSGYSKLCVRVNNEESCDFKQVTSEFGVNYIKDQYLKQQASQAGIKKQSDCISGTTNLLSLLQPNVQEGVESLIDPAIYNYGITRRCSTLNPGLGTDIKIGTNESRWVDVGYCDDENIRCWVDTESIKEVIKNGNIENQTLQGLTKQYLDLLASEGDYITDLETSLLSSDYNKDADTIEEINSNIDILTKIIDRLLLTTQKGYAKLLRGNEYGKLAWKFYNYSTTEIYGPKRIPCNESAKCPEGMICEDGFCVYGEEPEKVDKNEQKYFSGESFVEPRKFIVFTLDDVGYFFMNGGWSIIVKDATITVKQAEIMINKDPAAIGILNNCPSNLEEALDGFDYSKFVPADRLKEFEVAIKSQFIEEKGQSQICSLDHNPDDLVNLLMDFDYSDYVPADRVKNFENSLEVFGRLSLENYKVALDLVDINYEEGVKILIDEAVFTRKNLETNAVVMDSEKIFTVGDIENDKYYYFKFGGTSWEWSHSSKGSWNPTNVASPISDSFFEQIYHKIGPINEFDEGSRILFAVNLQDFFLDIEVYDSIKDQDLKNDVLGEKECESCGDGWFSDICDKEQCNLIGQLYGKKCVYYESGSEWLNWIVPGGSCREEGVNINKEGSKCSSFGENDALSVAFVPCIKISEIDSLLRSKNSPAAGSGVAFYNYGKRYNIDPIVALAFFSHESSFGTAGVATKTLGVGNIKYSPTCPGDKYTTYNSKGEQIDWCKYNSWEESIEDFYRLLNQKYVSSGSNTIEKIIPVYAPATENDVPLYISTVRNFVKQYSSQ